MQNINYFSYLSELKDYLDDIHVFNTNISKTKRQEYDANYKILALTMHIKDIACIEMCRLYVSIYNTSLYKQTTTLDLFIDVTFTAISNVIRNIYKNVPKNDILKQLVDIQSSVKHILPHLERDDSMEVDYVNTTKR